MTITEPATLITDYLLAAFTAVLATRLFTAARRNGRRSEWWWGTAFTATAVAGVTGGTVHGFRTFLHPLVNAVLWLAAIESLVLAAYAVVRAAVLDSNMRPAAARAATVAAAAIYVGYGVWVAGHPRFVFAIVAYAVSLLVLVVTVVAEWRAKRRRGRWILGGVAVSAVAAVVQQSGWSLHAHFNHNDLYHVVQAAGVWLLYRGALADPVRTAPGISLQRSRPV